MSTFVFNYEWISNFTPSQPIKISLKCMNETKKDYKKCSHYIIGAFFFFFKFKYLFFVILFYYDMFIISSSGDWNVRKVTGQGVENQDPVIYVRRLYMNWHVHIQPRTLFLLKRCLLNQLFLRTLPLALSNPSWFRSVFCFSSSCIQKKKRGKKTQQKLKRRRENVRFPTPDR